MSQILTAVIAPTSDRQIFIHADELTEGDVIKHFTGDIWMVVNEPEYTNAGITFEVVWLGVDTPDNTQTVSFTPVWRFELVSHQKTTQAIARPVNYVEAIA